MVQEQVLGSPAARRTAITAMARAGFGARGLIYLLVGAFAIAAALNIGSQPHGIVDAVQAVTDNRLRLVLAAIIGVGLACLAAYFAIAGVWRCARARGGRHWLFAAGMLADALIYAAVMICVLGILLGWHGDGEQETGMDRMGFDPAIWAQPGGYRISMMMSICRRLGGRNSAIGYADSSTSRRDQTRRALTWHATARTRLPIST